MTHPQHYQRHIDGLRAIAVLSVVFYHYDQPFFGGGFVGVDVFFVISGYLISGLIFREIDQTGKFSFGRFYIRRIRRLLPALLVTLLVSLVFAVGLLSPEQFQAFGRSLAGAALSVSNILFWQESGYFGPDASFRPLLHTWSLGVEEQFYLLWPALLWFFSPSGGRRRRLLVLMFTAVTSIALSWIWVEGNFDPNASATIFYLTPFRMFELAIGALGLFASRLFLRSVWHHELALGLGLCLIALAVVGYSDDLVFPHTSALLPSVGALLVIISGRARLAGLLLGNPVAVATGRLSYSLYLVHWPVLVFYKQYTFAPPGKVEYITLFAASMALAALMYFLVEQPLRKNAPSPTHNKPQKGFLLVCLALTTLLGITGFAIGRSNGATPFNSNALSLEQIEAGTRMRFQLTRQGCNLLRLDKPRFCKLGRPYQLLVIGNSHEPDGYNIFAQIYRNNPAVNLISFGTLNGCSIGFKDGAPFSSSNFRNCRKRVAMLGNREFVGELDGIIYSSNKPFDPRHAPTWRLLQSLRNINPDIPLVVLGGYINTTRKCSELFFHFGSFNACRKPMYSAYNPINEKALYEPEFFRKMHYLYISKALLMCSSTSISTCSTSAGNEPAFYDWHHLSFSFAKTLGQKVSRAYAQDLVDHGFPRVTPNTLLNEAEGVQN